MHPAPTFAMLPRGDLRLALSAPSGAGGGGQSMPDGTKPEPGGWNRFMLEVPDLATTVSELRSGDGGGSDASARAIGCGVQRRRDRPAGRLLPSRSSDLFVADRGDRLTPHGVLAAGWPLRCKFGSACASAASRSAACSSQEAGEHRAPGAGSIRRPTLSPGQAPECSRVARRRVRRPRMGEPCFALPRVRRRIRVVGWLGSRYMG